MLEQYEPAQAAPPPLAAGPLAAAMRITFPTIVTPYGIAALIIALANSPDAARTQGVLLVLLAVMALNLLAMLFAGWIMRGPVIIALQILGVVLGVLQIALAIELILPALRLLGPCLPEYMEDAKAVEMPMPFSILERNQQAKADEM